MTKVQHIRHVYCYIMPKATKTMKNKGLGYPKTRVSGMKTYVFSRFLDLRVYYATRILHVVLLKVCALPMVHSVCVYRVMTLNLVSKVS